MNFAGIDVGGTSTRAAIVAPDGSVRCRRTTRTPIDQNGDALIGWLAGAIASMMRELGGAKLDAPIGVAVPGIIDYQRRVIVRAVNLPFLQERAFIEEIEGILCHKVALLSDIQAATWAEFSSLSPAPRAFAHFRFGTGIGCACIQDGQFFPLTRTNGGHLDSLVVLHGDAALLCPCGKHGCLETIASRRALVERFAWVDLSIVQQALEQSDQRVLATAHELAEAVACAIANIAREVSIETVVVGGGVIEQLPALATMIGDAWKKQADRQLPAVGCVVRASQWGDDAGVIGAAWLAANEVHLAG